MSLRPPTQSVQMNAVHVNFVPHNTSESKSSSYSGTTIKCVTLKKKQCFIIGFTWLKS